MTKILLITGSTGFFGRAVLKQLEQTPYSLRLVLRPSENAKQLKHTNLERKIFCDDIFQQTPLWWEDVCKNVDAIIHLAWYVNQNDYVFSDKNIDCLTGSISLFRGAIAARVKKIVSVGTCLEYNLSKGDVYTNTPLSPNCLYASTKASLYYTAQSLCDNNNIEFLWARLFYLYGEGENKNRLFSLIENKLSKNQPVEINSANLVRDYQDVNISAEKFLNYVFSNKTGCVNICSETGSLIGDIAINLAKKQNKQHLLHLKNADITKTPARIIGYNREKP